MAIRHRAAWNKKDRLANPEKYRLRDRKQKLAVFGLTVETFDKKAQQQGNRCQICNEPETLININTKEIQPLSVDHNHTTGEIRGLLCAKCNSGLGFFRDNLEIVQAAVQYLQDYDK